MTESNKLFTTKKILQISTRLFSVLLLSWLFLFGSNTASAQGSQIAISPLVFELTGDRGDTIENFVKDLNPSEENSISLVMEFEKIVPFGEVGQVLPQTASSDEDNVPSVTNWIQAEPNEFTLGPGEERLVKFTINVPNDAEPGGHYASILASSKSVSGSGAVDVGVAYRIGSLVLLTIPGEFIEDLDVAGFQAPKYSEYGPVPFSIRLENNGSVHLKPNAIITVANMLGRKVAEIPVEGRNILPNSVRAIESEWDQKWLLGGRYTATLNGTYGRTDSQISPEVIVFWAFPWKIGLALLVVIFFFLITRRRWGAALRVLFRGDQGGNSPRKDNNDRVSYEDQDKNQV